MIFFNIVVGFIGAMQEFDRVYVMLNGTAGPSDSLLTPVLHLFINGFNYFKMGYASALAWILFTIILIATVLVLYISRNRVYYEEAL